MLPPTPSQVHELLLGGKITPNHDYRRWLKSAPCLRDLPGHNGVGMLNSGTHQGEQGPPMWMATESSSSILLSVVLRQVVWYRQAPNKPPDMAGSGSQVLQVKSKCNDKWWIPVKTLAQNLKIDLNWLKGRSWCERLKWRSSGSKRHVPPCAKHLV